MEKKASDIDCPAQTIKEEELQAAVLTAVNDAWSKKDAVLPTLSENIRSVLGGGMDDRIAELDGIIREKLAELLDAGNDEGRIDSIGHEIMRLREERQNLLTEAAMKQELKNRMEDITAFQGSQTEAVTEYSEALVRRLVEKITIYDEKLTVEFKSGFSIDVDA